MTTCNNIREKISDAMPNFHYFVGNLDNYSVLYDNSQNIFEKNLGIPFE